MSPLVEAKHAAERRIREEFQSKYGRFSKCPACGGQRVVGYWSPYGPTCTDCNVPAVRCGYEAPPPQKT